MRATNFNELHKASTRCLLCRFLPLSMQLFPGFFVITKSRVGHNSWQMAGRTVAAADACQWVASWWDGNPRRARIQRTRRLTRIIGWNKCKWSWRRRSRQRPRPCDDSLWWRCRRRRCCCCRCRRLRRQLYTNKKEKYETEQQKTKMPTKICTRHFQLCFFLPLSFANGKQRHRRQFCVPPLGANRNFIFAKWTTKTYLTHTSIHIWAFYHTTSASHSSTYFNPYDTETLACEMYKRIQYSKI